MIVDAKELWVALDQNTGFLAQLTYQGGHHRFVPLDAAARKMPTGAIGVAHKEHAILSVQHATLSAERQPARYPPIALQPKPDDLFSRQDRMSLLI